MQNQATESVDVQSSEYETYLNAISELAAEASQRLEPLLDADSEEEEPEEEPEPEWFAIVVPDDGRDPILKTYDSSAALAGDLIDLCGTDCHVFPGFGYLGSFTREPSRFLKLHDGEVYPLFRVRGAELTVDMEDLVMQEDYYLGTSEEQELSTPPPRVRDENDEDLTTELDFDDDG